MTKSRGLVGDLKELIREMDRQVLFMSGVYGRRLWSSYSSSCSDSRNGEIMRWRDELEAILRRERRRHGSKA